MHRWRFQIPAQIVLLALLAIVLGGCGAEDASEQGRPASGGSPAAADPEPSGTLFLRNARANSLTVVYLGRGEADTVRVAELAPGDPPFNLVETGGKLVFYGASGTYALDLDLRGSPRLLGDAWYFVPSATEGRVWLALLDPESPDTVRDLRAVREVAVDGRITVPDSGPPPCRGPTVLAAVSDGLLCQEDGLRVWDPATGEVIRQLPGPFVADTHGNLVAWCDHGCPRLHLTDVRSGNDAATSSTDSFVFEETYDGAFSPDGSLLAVPVVTGGAGRLHGDGLQHAVALIDVKETTARLVEGSERAGEHHPLMTWSPSAEWLFFSSGEKRLMAYRPGTERAVALPVELEQSFLDIAAG